MSNLAQLTEMLNQALQWCLDSANLHIVLMVGSGILAIGLLTLALTKWGAAQPVWKCVILSVMAHILLIGFTWGTHLIDPQDAHRQTLSEPMRVNFQENLGQEVNAPNPDTTIPQALPNQPGWDGFAVQSPLPDFAPAAELIRPGIASSVTNDYAMGRPAPIAPPQPQATQSLSTPQLQLPQSPLQTQQALTGKFLEQLMSTHVAKGPPTAPSPISAHKIETSSALTIAQHDQLNPDLKIDAQPSTDQQTDINSGIEDLSVVPQAMEGQFQVSQSKTQNTLPLPPHTPAGFVGKTATSNNQIDPNSTQGTAQLTPTETPPLQKRLADGAPMPQVYSLRSPDNRLQTVLRQGGSVETEQAVARALRWLAINQSRDGRWNPRKLGGGREDHVLGHDREGAGSRADSGITALAVLAFLANGHSHLEGPYKNSIRNALEYLVDQQSNDGDLAGDARLFARMYCHSMALLAISEAYAMTGDRRMAVPVQRGVNFSVRAQNKTDGGWRYQPGDAGDMSQFGWQVLALHSAEISGIDISRNTKQKMVSFLDACCISPHKGVAAYRPKQGPNTTMTAEALVCRSILGQRLSRLTVAEAHDRISNELPSPQNVNMYYWYYGTLAMYVSGGPQWQRWNQRMKETLLELQTRSGDDEGSWAPTGMWAGYGGRVYSTAMAALTLEVYYRYLPVYDVANQNSPTFR